MGSHRGAVILQSARAPAGCPVCNLVAITRDLSPRRRAAEDPRAEMSRGHGPASPNKHNNQRQEGGFMTRMILRPAVAAALCTVAAIVAVASASAQQITMKIGHPLAPKTGLHEWAERLKAGLDKRAPGRINVEIYPASQLGAIPRMIEGAQLGTIELTEVPPEFLSGVDPRFAVFSAPSIFEDIAHGDRTVRDPEFKKVFWPVGEAKGLKLVGFTCDAPTDYAAVRPIRTLADFRGLKLRVFGSRVEIEALRRLGASGVPMPLSEVLPAIQQRTIDGNKAGIPVFVPFQYQTVAKYVLRAKESIICVTKLASKMWFDKLPADLKTIVLEEAARVDDEMLAWNTAYTDGLYKAWVQNGGVLTELSPADQAELRERLSAVGDEVFKDNPEVLEVYRVMKSVAERRRKG
jgi:TRAP-type C4-dicarboxylate transport system substrate-binding protein